MEHFLALCCFGGEPFIDFHLNSSIDPTDWSADVVNDLNTTIPTNLTSPIEQVGVALAECQMFNITFTDLADQTMFDNYKANFLCRCPFGRTGQSCELQSPIALALSSEDTLSEPNPIMMVLVVAAVVLAMMAVLAMMVKGCFCELFSHFSREDPYDKPLDPEDVRQCLQKVRENQAAREMAREPLVNHTIHPPPMVSESYSAPYAQGPPPPVQQQYPSAPHMNYRPPSPPPAYSDIDKVPTTQI